MCGSGIIWTEDVVVKYVGVEECKHHARQYLMLEFTYFFMECSSPMVHIASCGFP